MTKQIDTFEHQIRKSFANASETEYADTGEWMKRTYRKLHQIAVSQMSYEHANHTLSATSLIHEVFLLSLIHI